MIHITLVFEEYSVVQIHPAVISDGESNMCMSITSYSLMIENTDNCKIQIKISQKLYLNIWINYGMLNNLG